MVVYEHFSTCASGHMKRPKVGSDSDLGKTFKRLITKIYGTVSAKIAPRLKCYKNASRLNRYNFPTDNAIDFLFSTLHSEMV